jgi:hypothetical protein
MPRCAEATLVISMHHRHLCSKDCGRRPPPLQLPGAVHGILWPWNSPTTPCIVRLRHRRKSRSWSAVSGPRVCELEGTRGASPTLWVRAGCPALCVSPSRTLPNPPLPSLRLAALPLPCWCWRAQRPHTHPCADRVGEGRPGSREPRKRVSVWGTTPRRSSTKRSASRLQRRWATGRGRAGRTGISRLRIGRWGLYLSNRAPRAGPSDCKGGGRSGGGGRGGSS